MALGDTKSIVPRADQQGTLGTAAKSWGQLFINNPSLQSAPAVTIDHATVNQIALDINASNTTADVLDIAGTALTTGSLVDLTGTATPADGSSNNLVDFTGTFSGVGTSTFKGVHLDVNKGAVTASGKTATLYGMHIDLDDAVTNVGTVNAYGLVVESTFANAGGAITNYGVYASASGGDSNFDLALVNGTVTPLDNDFTLSGFATNKGAVLTRRKFDVPGTTDGTHDGDVVYFGPTEELFTGSIVYYNGSVWAATDADAASTASGLIGVALGPNVAETGVLLRGMVTLNHDPGTIGDILYLSTTAGQASSTAPSGTGDIVRVIGYCLDSSNGQIWFNPDNTFVEIS